MNIAVITDVHGNLQALNAVMDDISRYVVDKVACLGDVVNYGANSKECLDIILKECDIRIRGNHEDAILKGDYGFFSSERGRNAAIETASKLSHHDLAEIENYFDPHYVLEVGEKKVLFVHASVGDYWNPICKLSDDEVLRIYHHYDIVVFGHTHVPGMRKIKNGSRMLTILNPGAVGQPRDLCNKAAWLLINTETGAVEFKRVDYDYEEAALSILQKTDHDLYYSNRLRIGC